jgi:hypothetical protein
MNHDQNGPIQILGAGLQIRDIGANRFCEVSVQVVAERSYSLMTGASSLEMETNISGASSRMILLMARS